MWQWWFEEALLWLLMPPKGIRESESGAPTAQQATTRLRGIADEETASPTLEPHGTTPSEMAAFDLVDLTRRLKTADEQAVMDMLQTHLCDSQLEDATKETIKDEVLRWACYHGSRPVVQNVLDTKRSPNMPVDKHGRTPLYIASQQGRAELVELLLAAKADPDVATMNGWTPLYAASQLGHTEVVERLLKARAKVNVTVENGRTALYTASQQGHVRAVELLLRYGAQVNAAAEDGQTPLYNASWRDHTKIITLLLRNGADATMSAEYRWTPLHAACARLSHNVIILLAPHNASAFEDIDGYRPLHLTLLRVWHKGCSETALKVLRTLVECGSQWDKTCDKISSSDIHWPVSMGEKPSDTSNQQWKVEAPALRACIERWVQQLEKGLELTEVPIEDVCRGLEATMTYITAFAESLSVVFRRKICVVGPGSWGKTSLLKSLTTREPSLEHVDKRTIGIDHFKLEFEERLRDKKKSKKHQVTFWDFAGQDAYQVTHSLFFSARTLYVVCIDLHAFLTAWMQAQLMTDNDSQADKWVNDFIDSKILRWIRVICARQPDAEFVFVATKKDRIRAADLDGEDGLLTELHKRMANVAVIIEEMKKKVDKESGDGQRLSTTEKSSQQLPIVHLEDPRLANISKLRRIEIIVTSSARWHDVYDFKAKIQDVIKKSNRGYPMPDEYTRVLETLLIMRKIAKTLPADKRVDQSFLREEKLINDLVQQVRNDLARANTLNPTEPYLDKSTCSIILRTLRDLGDVLWYDNIGVEELRNTIIIDPMLMIDLVREIFNHKRTAEVMTHRTLQTLKFWQRLDGTPGMLSMKLLLQYFQLVYPTTPEMKANSDLIVPAYWQTKLSGFWKFGGADLRFGPGIFREDVAVRVHWEFLFENNYPHTLFDHLVVASYEATYKRDVGPDWIMYMTKDKCACRIVLKRAIHSHHWVLHLEALQGLKATADDKEHLWKCFKLMANALEKVIRGYPGVVVCRSARDDPEEDSEQTTIALDSIRGSELSVPSRKWMPPQGIWEEYLKFWSG